MHLDQKKCQTVEERCVQSFAMPSAVSIAQSYYLSQAIETLIADYIEKSMLM